MFKFQFDVYFMFMSDYHLPAIVPRKEKLYKKCKDNNS